MKTVTICSSAAFYEHANDIKAKLEQAGFKVIIPKTAIVMRENNDYDVSHYKTWFAEPGNYHKKSNLMRDHFDEVAKADAVLVLNNEKNGVPNYIGGNVLREMAPAFYFAKPIYVFNDLPKESPFLEEILGMQPTALQGDVNRVTKLLMPNQ